MAAAPKVKLTTHLKRGGKILMWVGGGAIVLNTAARRFQLVARARNLLTNGF